MPNDAFKVEVPVFAKGLALVKKSGAIQTKEDAERLITTAVKEDDIGNEAISAFTLVDLTPHDGPVTVEEGDFDEFAEEFEELTGDEDDEEG
jgi:hypothetical protein